MEENPEPVEESISPGQMRTIKIVVIIVVVLLPLLYLLLKSKSPAPADLPPVVAAQPAADIPALESKVQAAPTAENMVNLSVAYINNKMPGKCISLLKKAIKLSPDSKQAYNNLGVAYTMLRQYNNGIAACNRAISLDNNFQLAKNNLKWANDENAKVIATIKTLETTPADKQNNDYFLQLGLNYFYVGDYDKSIAVYQQGLAKYPNNAVLINDIGTTLVMQQKYDDALIKFNEVLKLDPNNQLAKNNIGWAMSEKAGN